MEKIKIEKGTVQETLLIPLYGRKYAMDCYPDLFMDHDCQVLFDKIDFTVPDNMKGMLKTWLKGFEMKDINVYFSVDDVHTLKEWSRHISSAVSNPYLTGYRPLDKRYGFITNIVFRYLDRSKMCQIIELKFD